MIETLKQHINLFESFSSAHTQINSFGFGDPWEWYNKLKGDGEHLVYPAMFVAVQPSNVDDGYLVDTYEVFFADVQQHAEGDEDYTLSDTKMLALDFMAYLAQADIGDQNLVRSTTLTPLTERSPDYLCGWSLTLQLRQPYTYNWCQVPMSGITGTGNECPYVTIYNNDGSLNTTVPAGGSYTLAAVGGSYVITINSSAWDTISADTDIPVVNTSATPVGSKVGTNWVIGQSLVRVRKSNFQVISDEYVDAEDTINYSVADSNVSNSDASYSQDVRATENLVLPDITFTDTDNTTSSKPAAKNFSATLIPNLSCAQLNHASNGLTFTQRNYLQAIKTVQTGQTTSYRTGDDGDFEYGRLSGFGTLPCNNPFGNANRFTDELGGQTYTNNLVVDWATGLMWYRTVFSGVDWNAAIDNPLASTQGGYSDWYLPNVQQLTLIVDYENTQSLNYAPFNYIVSNTANSLWTSTTRATATTQAYALTAGTLFSNAIKTGSSNRSYIMCRYFTLADLGL